MGVPLQRKGRCLRETSGRAGARTLRFEVKHFIVYIF